MRDAAMAACSQHHNVFFKMTKIQFKEIINARNPSARFLICLAPLFAKAYKEFKKIKKYNPTLKRILSDQFLKKMIKRDLSMQLHPLINRVCVYEMHMLAKAGKLKGETAEKRFTYFITLLQKKWMVNSLFKKYPVLNHLIKKVFKQYLRTRKELFFRLQKDYQEINQLFFAAKMNWEIDKIDTAGDMHQQGRSVSIFTFKNDNKQTKIVYKPYSLDIDFAFQQWINWFNEHFAEIDLICPTILQKENYGWCQFIAFLPCQTENDLRLFYKRIGLLLCISYLLGSSDLHAENIIAHGAYPIIIDHECILRPILQYQKNLAHEPQQFVLHTFLLPNQYLARQDYNGLDVSGIAGHAGQETPYRSIAWEKTGTDAMYMRRKKVRTQKYFNIPLLNGKAAIPENYENEIISSFKNAYEFIMNNKTQLLSNRSPLHFFKNIKIRIVCNETNVYKKLLVESFHPQLLHCYKAYREHFHWLQKFSAFSAHHACFNAELSDLLSNNIPYFFSESDQYCLYDSQKKVLPIKIILSGLERVIHHLRSYFGIEDLTFQCQLIANSFTALRMNKKQIQAARHVLIATKNQILQTLSALTREQLAEMSILYGDQLLIPTIQPVGISSWTANITKMNAIAQPL